jgi:hypothetical protein
MRWIIALLGNVSKVFKPRAKDKFYTPKILVDIIQPYVDSLYSRMKNPVVWLPFDTEESEFAYIVPRTQILLCCLTFDGG